MDNTRLDIGYECDVEDTSDEEEPCEVSDIEKRKRGRPQGSYKRTHDSTDDESRIPEITRRKRRRIKSINDIAAVFCCATLCLAVIPSDTIIMFREHISSLTKIELSQWVLDWLWTHPRSDGKFTFLVGEWTVCLTAFLTIIGMPLSTYYTIRKKYQKGEKVIGRQGCEKGKHGSKTENAMLWLLGYANKFADKIPNEPKLHLPTCLTKAAVYEMYTDDMETSGDICISLSHFYWVWRNCVSYVSIPPVSRFSKCNICTQIKTKLAETKDKNKREELQQLREKHLLKQNLERKKYHKHAFKAKQNPERYLSIILDGMDQSKTELPHFVYISSLLSCMWKLRIHLIGAIVHGIGVYGFFDWFQYPHSSNLTIHALLSIFLLLNEKIPDTLYLQMDNCGRENKNRYILAFMCLLVELKVFRKIKVSFLMVGHTHEDIDQVFSRFSVYLKKHSCPTLPTLMKGFEKSYSPPPFSSETSNVYDVTGWLQNYINPITGHSKPHVFKITLGENNKAKLMYKKWSTDKIWKDCEGNLLSKCPPGVPLVLKENIDKLDITRLKCDINKCSKQYNIDKNGWWREFFDLIDTLQQPRDECSSNSWILDRIISAKQSQRIIVENMDLSGNCDIEGLSDEDEVPAVKIGRLKQK